MLSSIWDELKKQKKAMETTRLVDLFQRDSNRFQKFSLKFNELLLDYAKQRVDEKTIQTLCALAEASDLKNQIDALFTGKVVNESEGRPALHTALRDFSEKPLWVEERNVKAPIQAVLARMAEWVEAFRAGQSQEANQEPIRDIISLGIGGSDLGPTMVLEALREYHTGVPVNIHFISNLDGYSLASVLKKCNPAKTLCFIHSKTFTTLETMKNADQIKLWLTKVLGEKGALQRLIGITAYPERAKNFGILPNNIFEFWEFVGGRYSVWSAVGLTIALVVGMDHFRSFLEGAYAMDYHFREAPFHQNMPVLMGLLGIWNSNFWECRTQAVIVYDDGLRKFPDYLQQLEMESNGKKAMKNGEGFVNHTTAPVIWGGVGCNSQHAYMQLLHQGTQVVPVDFLIAVTGHPDFLEHQQLLAASCFSQSKALMEGNFLYSVELESKVESKNKIISHISAKKCLGDRPSSTLIYPKLTPAVLGSLITLYEHKVFVQGVLWGINSFDQWGVELGKKLVGEILPHLQNPESRTSKILSSKNDLSDNGNIDGSTAGLIDFFKRHQV